MWNSLSRYHPRIGFTLMPSIKSRITWETGGYLVRTNAAGFRSEREFVAERTPGKFRVIVFGDSQTAGDGNPNADRYSDVLEKLLPDVEVYNYGLPATGPDQHYLAYLDCAKVEHDLVVIGMHVENILRIVHRFRPYTDSQGKEVIYAKPYFELENGELVLRHVPVPRELLTRETISAEDAKHVELGVPYAALRSVVKKLGMRDIMQRLTRFQPVPDYESPDNPKWLLLRAIFEKWIRESPVPVMIFLIPMWPFIEESSDPADYRQRYQELAKDTGCYLHDPLEDLWKYSEEERRNFRFKIDSHLTASGHHALALSLAKAIEPIMAASRR